MGCTGGNNSMVILARYSPRSKDRRIKETAPAREPIPATGLAMREITPLTKPKTPRNIIKPVRKRGTRLSGTPLTAEAFTRLMIFTMQI